MNWPHSRNPGPGVTFFKPQREPFPWPAVLVVGALVVGALIILGLLLLAPAK